MDGPTRLAKNNYVVIHSLICLLLSRPVGAECNRSDLLPECLRGSTPCYAGELTFTDVLIRITIHLMGAAITLT